MGRSRIGYFYRAELCSYSFKNVLILAPVGTDSRRIDAGAALVDAVEIDPTSCASPAAPPDHPFDTPGDLINAIPFIPADYQEKVRPLCVRANHS